MYAKCGELKDARQVFDSLATKDVVTWNALIAGYAQQGLGQEALVVYGRVDAGSRASLLLEPNSLSVRRCSILCKEGARRPDLSRHCILRGDSSRNILPTMEPAHSQKKL